MKIKQFKEDFKLVLEPLKKKAPIYIASMIVDKILISVCYNIVLAFILKDVINAIAYKDITLIYRAVYVAVISFLIAFTFEPVIKRLCNYCVRSTMGELRNGTFKKVEYMTVSQYEKNTAGDLLTRLTKDINTIEAIYNDYIPMLVFALIHGTFSMAAMVFVNPALGFAGIGLGIVSVFVNSLTGGKIKKYSGMYQKSFSKLSEDVYDMKEGFSDIKLNSSEEYFYNKYDKDNYALKKNYVGREKYQCLLDTSNELFARANDIGLMALGLFMAVTGYTTIGSVLSVVRLQGNAGFLFQNISSFIAGIQKTIPAVERVRDIFQFEVESSEEDLKDSSINVKENSIIKVENLNFAYDEKRKILNNLSLDIKEGELISITGESGCGKSSFIRILLGFYRKASGKIEIRGKDIENYRLNELREHISYVAQDAYLFNMSVADNIRLGNMEASREDIIKACRLAGAHDFIMNLDSGYDTIIDEKAENISGGQKQRIALARALISKGEIILMDETTSALDNETEKIIYKTLEKLKGKKTILLVSHKSSVKDIVDRNIEFKVTA